MHDYMRALRQRFYSPPECEKLRAEFTQAHGALHERLDIEERKLLLRIVDLESAIHDEVSLHSFIAGFRLAEGIKEELADFPLYSFDKEEEQLAERRCGREEDDNGNTDA